MWARVRQQNADHEARYHYIEARRREMDTESNWSTNAAVGGPGVNQGGVLPSRYVPRNWEYVFNSPDETLDEARERDRWAGLDYRAAHLTWTHKCYGRRNCNWSLCLRKRSHTAEGASRNGSKSTLPSTARGVQSASGTSPHRATGGFLLHTLQGIHRSSDSLRARVRR